ncbi:MAG TPA: hypothetical protein PK003_10870 [Bacillota bacterium]|nr:hypothetical protein [Bacillota bacterium]
MSLPMEIPVDNLTIKQREKLAADECMEACREWRRREISGHQLCWRVREIQSKYGLGPDGRVKL